MAQEYFALNVEHVVGTARTLRVRIEERFPGAGLSRVAQTVEESLAQTGRRAGRLRQPQWWIRASIITASLVSVLALIWGLIDAVDWSPSAKVLRYTDVIGTVEATMGSVVFMIAFFAFLWSFEMRWTRRFALQAITELRALAHVVDMHQLTKDPSRFSSTGPDTEASPARGFTRFQLSRYLDYSSELLSLISKNAALWAQAFPEPSIVTAVDQVESLCTGFSRKIWQKLMVLERLDPPSS